ncbi:cytochrome c oxidase cbb3-type subunit 4 [Pseudorhodobacter antarcticus]|jgi:cytochrome c oxidase cbb3-type subunit 4|uniref:Cytochrome c oxidase cbb3-type subunit 4 n=1 Tax=Pseudorhodobacter antarcticus TaxID=1077947 RepID=A0A1H8E2E8_9RHOB|nr:CcoQ/FixQ family Cbb3-type cytochrome c oxidase assembly chaperone [Pseudorhodobacter antarcticus]SEN13615.1 cytochrome c oxidase cbb3-type subunit 4 [Pseudorhodobacter antarcticus]
METYSLLREFADSWMLLALTLVFVAVIAWAFRPGSRPTHDEIASSIFRNDDKPAADSADRAKEART